MSASASTILEAQVDGEQRVKAAAVLDRLGLTIGEAVALLIDRIAEDDDLPADLAFDRADHDAWVTAEVKRALSDKRKPVWKCRRNDISRVAARMQGAAAAREARVVSLGHRRSRGGLRLSGAPHSASCDHDRCADRSCCGPSLPISTVGTSRASRTDAGMGRQPHA